MFQSYSSVLLNYVWQNFYSRREESSQEELLYSYRDVPSMYLYLYLNTFVLYLSPHRKGYVLVLILKVLVLYLST